MSTISVSGLSTLYQSGSTYAPQVQASDSDDTTVGQTTDADDASQSQGPQPQHVHHHHGGGGGHGQFFSKLQSAVTSALQAAQSDGSTDPNQAIQNAIESVLKGQNGSPTDPSNGGASDPTSAPSSGAPTDPQAAKEAFFQTLQSFGVNAQQFHQDFLSAVQDAKNGNADPSSAFQSLPPGSVVDTTG